MFIFFNILLHFIKQEASKQATAEAALFSKKNLLTLSVLFGVAWQGYFRIYLRIEFAASFCCSAFKGQTTIKAYFCVVFMTFRESKYYFLCFSVCAFVSGSFLLAILQRNCDDEGDNSGNKFPLASVLRRFSAAFMGF